MKDSTFCYVHHTTHQLPLLVQGQVKQMELPWDDVDAPEPTTDNLLLRLVKDEDDQFSQTKQRLNWADLNMESFTGKSSNLPKSDAVLSRRIL